MLRLLALLALVLITACRSQPPVPPTAPPVDSIVAWSPVDSLNMRLPESIRVFGGINDTMPLRAWYVQMAPRHRAHIVMSDDASDNRESPSDFAAPDSICVASNAGYFTVNKSPAGHVGLLQVDGQLLEPATQSVTRDDTLRFPTARATLGILPNGGYDIAWVASRGDTLYALDTPPAHRPGQPALLDLGSAAVWSVEDAIGTGPMLIKNGQLRVTSDEEVFFGTSIPEVHPRTAAGYTATGDLILLVVDGRQDLSRGVSLEELAQMMLSLGALEALNLDGGGSSALVVDGVRLNRPTGSNVEREVMSAVVGICSP